MKSQIFSSAICNRHPLRFIYGLSEVILEPYYITRDRAGKKVIYGRTANTNEIKKFEFEQISNIRILARSRFSPIIPLRSKVV